MKLTQARLKEVLEYDPATGVFHWRASRNNGIKLGAVAGSKDSDGYIRIKIDGKLYLAHRLAWLYAEGYLPENDIDHEDRNPSNNRLDNLREVSNQCNIRNTGNWTTNTSGVKGVCWHKRDNKWNAQIMLNGKRKSLGYYEDFDDAVKARYEAEKAANWSGCDSSSPAYKYLRDNNLLEEQGGIKTQGRDCKNDPHKSQSKNQDVIQTEYFTKRIVLATRRPRIRHGSVRFQGPPHHDRQPKVRR